MAKSVSADGTEALEVDSPMRDFYLFGAGMQSVTITDNYQAKTTDQVILADCSVKNKNIVVTLSPAAFIHTKDILVKKKKTDMTAFTVTVQGSNGEALN